MKKYFIISQIIYVLFLLPWFGIFIMSFMSFDAGFSTWNVAFVSAIAAYPAAAIVCSILAWVFHKRRKGLAKAANAVPMLWVAGIVVLLVYVFVA
ncbi:hypothetical protein [Paenibacillus lignilyticus]|uniref:Uncharacterized protein n=1 Tax=Paenibacillus lignilyticus TaxID=1172615 RepID=A0ABS5CJI6_9BACL|nr:hypothetical protein [Paenibacillus lignilyticus]MBP3966034.1 hypothetical protein [Paenibacillus lignilyticus]